MKEKQPKAFAKLPRWLLRDRKISIPARLLLAILRSYCYHGDTCWPASATLAKDMGCSERQLFRYLNELAGHPNRLISRSKKEPGNPKSVTIYTLHEKKAEERLQKLADPKRELKSKTDPGLLTPMSAILLTPMSDEVEEPLKERDPAVAEDSGRLMEDPGQYSAGTRKIVRMTPRGQKSA